MKKILFILIMLVAVFTETAYAASVNVAVIDTGIHIKNGNMNETRILPGWNYVTDSSDTDDLVGHGTRITSIILGTENGGIMSPCQETNVVPLVYYTKYASGSVRNGGLESICQAIYDAVDVYGCRIINLSSGVTDSDERLEKAVEYAREHDVLIIAASGNDPDVMYYPAAYTNVLGVGSHHEGMKVSSFSGRGSGLDLLAEGENLRTESIRNAHDYEIVSGTSYATAVITSEAAALLEIDPQLSERDLRFLLCASCKDIYEPGWDATSGYGVFDQEAFRRNAELFRQGKLIPYLDVTENDWFYDAVKEVTAMGFMGETGAYQFSPNGTVTRAMLAAILYRMEGEPLAFEEVMFQDVPCDTWYNDAVRWAVESGLICGYGSGKFGPNDPVTRQQLAVILYRYASGEGETEKNKTGLEMYHDSSEIAEWAWDSMEWAVSCGIFKGTGDGDLQPGKEIRRSETAIILTRFYDSFIFNR